jgi:hypothetical protein
VTASHPSSVKPHVAAQHAIVRMLFDPAFAAAVRAQPDVALPSLPPSLRAQLAAIDPRALKLDRLRGRRVLGTLFDELKASTTIFLGHTHKLAALDRFYASPEFARAVAGEHTLASAYAGFLGGELPSLRPVLTIEEGLHRARQAAPPPRDGRVHLAPGVLPLATTQGGLSALQQAEQYLFEVGLMPAVALCDDAPKLRLDERARDDTPLFLVTVPTETGHSLVTIDRETHDLLAQLPQPITPALQALVDDEIAVRT